MHGKLCMPLSHLLATFRTTQTPDPYILFHMKIITVKSPRDPSFSFSRRHFSWKKKIEDDDDEEEILTFSSSSHFREDAKEAEEFRIPVPSQVSLVPRPRKKLPTVAVSKLLSALSVFGKNRSAYR